MILQALVKYYEQLAEEGKVSRPGWCSGKVSYGINLSEEGEIKGVFFLKQEEEKGKKKVWIPRTMNVPEMGTRASGISANFLCDNSKYFLGIDADMEDGKKKKRAGDCFHASKKRHLALLENVSGSMAKAIRLFFEHWNPENAMENEEIKGNWEGLTDGGNLVFCMGKNFAAEDTAIKSAWEEARQKTEKEVEGICLVTGEQAEIARIHKTIKGVPGAQSSGAALVSFNAPAFESYGKVQSYNAPVGKYAEFAYTTALNYLLEQRKYALQIGDTMVVFWAESGKKEYQDIFSMSIDPVEDNQATLKAFFEKLKKQEYIEINDIEINPEQRFYILGLAPNAARLSVRFFYQNSFGNILHHISEHYKRMEMVKPAWENREYLNIRQIVFETVNRKSKDKKPIPNMAAMVMKAVISGSRYPESLYANILIRIRAEQGKVTWGRASAIKAYLIRNCNLEEGDSYMGLNKNRKDRPYVLGRLFAVLEGIQMDANPDIKATIRDRYFNSACASPASIFPVLIKLKNSHIRKLEREKGNSKKYYENLLMEIMEKFDDYPKQLSLEEQGVFVLGYYHQMQKKFEKKENK